MNSTKNNDDNEFTPAYSVSDDANELVEHLTDFFTSLKIAAAKQLELKQSLATRYGTSSFQRAVDNVTAYIVKLPKFVEESSSNFHTLSAERLKVITQLSHKLEEQNKLFRINCLLISSLYWLRIYVRETISILPYLIDVSLGLQDLHSIVSAIDAVEKLIQSGSLKQLFVSATISSCMSVPVSSFGNSNVTKRLPVSGFSASMSTIYTLLLEPSASITLSKALNGFADVRAQLTSNKLMASLQNIFHSAISQSTAGALRTNHESADDDNWLDFDDESRKKTFHKKHPFGNATDNNRFPDLDALAVSSATSFQEECGFLFYSEFKIARSLIDCFSQSTGFVQALSRKSLHKSISMDAGLMEQDENGDDDNGEQNNEQTNIRPRTASRNSRKSKSVVWVDSADTGVRNKLETAYSNWYFRRLKSAILGRCLFAMHSYTGENGISSSAQWSLNWKAMRESSNLLLKILNGDVLNGPPRELLGLVLSSILLRSYELQMNAITDEVSNLMQEDRLTFLDKADDMAPCQTAIGARIFLASLEVIRTGPQQLVGIPQPLYDQLFRLELSAFRSLLEFCRHFISTRTGVFLARKSYVNFIAVESEVDILVAQFRTVLSNLKEIVQTSTSKESQGDVVTVEALLVLVNEIETLNGKQRDLFVNRLNDDTRAFLTENMPLAPANWRKRSTNQRSKLVGGESNSDNGYVAFSIQPNPYAFGLCRSCLNSYSTPLLSSIMSRDSLPVAHTFARQLFFECITSMFTTWLKFILDKSIKFSPMGARQLEADFQNVQFLIEQQISSFGGNNHSDARDSVAEEERLSHLTKSFRSLPIVHQLRSVIYILLSKNADFNLSTSSQESEVADSYLRIPHRSDSADPEGSPAENGTANNKAQRRSRRRSKRGGGASADSDVIGQSSRIYPVPFGADAWLHLIDDWPDNPGGNRLFTSQSSNEVSTVCQCVPRFWRRTPPTPI